MLARISISAARTIPDHDAVNGSWPHARAEAYARSAARAGRSKDAKTERQNTRRLTSVFRAALVGGQQHGIRADRIMKAACRPVSTIPVSANSGSATIDPLWTLHDALEDGVVTACIDPSLLHAIAFHDAAPRPGIRDAAVVVCAWREDDRVHMRATMMAGGILGLRSFVLDLDGALHPDAEENHNSRYSDDLHVVLPILTASVSECLTGIPTNVESDRCQESKATVPKADESNPAVSTTNDMTVVEAVTTPLLTQEQADALTIIMEGNAVTRRLLHEIRPMLRPEGNADPSGRPFEMITARRVVEDGRLDELLETLKGRSEAEISALKKAGRDAEADAAHARAQSVLNESSRPHVIAHAARQYADLEPLHSATSRLLERVANLADDALSGTVEMLDEDAEIDLRSKSATAGVHVVRSADLVDALKGVGVGTSPSNLFPVVIVHASEGDGCSAVALQLAEGRIAVGAFRSIDADGTGPLDDDLTWLLARVVAGARSSPAEGSASSSSNHPDTGTEARTPDDAVVETIIDDRDDHERMQRIPQQDDDGPRTDDTPDECIGDEETIGPIIDERLTAVGLSVEMLSGLFEDDDVLEEPVGPTRSPNSESQGSRSTRRLRREEIIGIVEEAMKPLDERLDRIESLLQRLVVGDRILTTG